MACSLTGRREEEELVHVLVEVDRIGSADAGHRSRLAAAEVAVDIHLLGVVVVAAGERLLRKVQLHLHLLELLLALMRDPLFVDVIR